MLGGVVKKFAYCLISVGGGRVAVPEVVDCYMSDLSFIVTWLSSDHFKINVIG